MISKKLHIMVIRPLKIITESVRNAGTKPTTNGKILPVIINRNPRNLEKLRLVRKPSGYGLEKKFVEFWHKMEVIPHSKHVSAHLIHNTGRVVVEASTNEWAIRKFLYSAKDKQAYITLARVFAERCLESGIITFAAKKDNITEGSNLETFFKVLEEEGLLLEEPSYYDIHMVWARDREKRPWTVLEDDNV